MLLALALLAPAGCDGTAGREPAPSPSPSPAAVSGQFVPPALRLPTLDPGASCPGAPRRPWSPPPVAGGVFGDGPVYPVADYFRDGASLELRETDRLPGGGYEAKVRWIVSGYTGPVLVRAGRIDGPGTARVRFSYQGEPRHGGHYAELVTPQSDLPATTFVSGPGCYAYQVDGATFSDTIVFRAVRAPG